MISNYVARDWLCFIMGVLMYIAWGLTFFFLFKEGLKKKRLKANSESVKTPVWMWILAYLCMFGFFGLFKLLGGGKL